MPKSWIRLVASEAEPTPFAPGEEPIWTADVDAALQTGGLAEPIPDSALR